MLSSASVAEPAVCNVRNREGGTSSELTLEAAVSGSLGGDQGVQKVEVGCGRKAAVGHRALTSSGGHVATFVLDRRGRAWIANIRCDRPLTRRLILLRPAPGEIPGAAVFTTTGRLHLAAMPRPGPNKGRTPNTDADHRPTPQATDDASPVRRRQAVVDRAGNMRALRRARSSKDSRPC